jgi:hypothetical protein
MSTLADKLREARALIDTPEKWTQGANARDAAGRKVPAYSSRARCFCMTGAVIRVMAGGFDAAVPVLGALRKGANGLEGGSPHLWNDAPERTHAEVLAAFDRAIEAAQATT